MIHQMGLSVVVVALGTFPTWWLFRIFFFAWGKGRRSPRCRGGGGVRFFIENPRRGGGVSRAGGGGEGEGPGGCLREIWGRGLNIFSGPRQAYFSEIQPPSHTSTRCKCSWRGVLLGKHKKTPQGLGKSLKGSFAGGSF